MADPDEDDLIRRAGAGDREAFAALAGRYWGRLGRWLRGLTGDPDAADDLTQEALLRAWRRLDTFRPGADFRTWLFQIARNAWTDQRRGPRGVPPGRLPPDLPARGELPPDAAAGRELLGRFEAALARLPDGLRAAFLLWSREGLSFAAVAEVCGVTEPTARWRVFKARHLLVRMLGDCLDGTTR